MNEQRGVLHEFVRCIFTIVCHQMCYDIHASESHNSHLSSSSFQDANIARRVVRHALQRYSVVFSVSPLSRTVPPRTPIAASISVSPAAIALAALDLSPGIVRTTACASIVSGFKCIKLQYPLGNAILLVLPTLLSLKSVTGKTHRIG